MSASHISDSEPLKASTSMSSLGPGDTTLPTSPRSSPQRNDITTTKARTTYSKRADAISLPATTPEADDTTMITTFEEPRLFNSSSPVKAPDGPSSSSDGGMSPETMRRMKASMFGGRDIRAMDEVLRDGDEEDEEVQRALAAAAVGSPSSTPVRTTSKGKVATSPTSEVDEGVIVGGKRKSGKRVVVDDSSDDEDALPDARRVPTLTKSRSEEIVEEISSSSTVESKAKKGAAARKGLDFAREDSVEALFTAPKKGKMKGLSKRELEETKREAAALQRKHNPRLEPKKAHVQMSDLLNKVKAKARPSEPKALSARIPSMPPPSIARSATPASTAAPSATPFEDYADEQYGGESYDARYLETQSIAPVRTTPFNRHFTTVEESDPIEPASQIARSDLNEDDDEELPDAVEVMQSVTQAAERKVRLAKLKSQALASAKPTAKPAARLRASSSDDDLQFEERPPVNLLGDRSAKPRLSGAKREIVRTESQLVRAGKAFSTAKAEPPVTHGQLSMSLLAQTRLNDARLRKQKAEDFLASGGRMRADAQPAPVEATETDINELLERKRAAAGAEGGSEDAEEADDGDFDPDAVEAEDADEVGSVDFGSGAEEEDDEAGSGDEEGSVDGEEQQPIVEIRPDSPKKPSRTASPSQALEGDRDSSEERTVDKENRPFFADMQPINFDRPRIALPPARAALSQLTASSEPVSPTQIVGGAEAAAPFHPGMPLDMDALGDGGGFSQLFDDDEVPGGKSIFDAPATGAFLPTQLAHPGRTLLPAFKPNAIIEDMIESQLEAEGAYDAFDATPGPKGPQQWINADGLLTQHKPTEYFEPVPVASPSQMLMHQPSFDSMTQSPTRTQAAPSPSPSPVRERKLKRLRDESDDEDDLPNADASDSAPNAFAMLQAGAKKQAARAEKEAKRQRAAGFLDEQAERSDEEEGNRYGRGLLGGDEDEHYEGSDDDDGADLESLVDDDKVAPDVQLEQDVLAEARHKEDLAKDDAKREKLARGVIAGQARKNKRGQDVLTDSDYDEDDGELQRRNRPEKKRKGDDGTMASLAANPATEAFAAGYKETFEPTESAAMFAWVNDDNAPRRTDSDDDEAPVTQKSRRSLKQKTPAPVVVHQETILHAEPTTFRAFADSDEDDEAFQTQTASFATRKAPFAPHQDVSNLYIKPKARILTVAQREAALEESQGRSMSTGGEGRRAGNVANSAITSFKQRPGSKSSSTSSTTSNGSGRSQLATKPSNILANKTSRPAVAPTRSLSTLSSKAKFGR